LKKLITLLLTLSLVIIFTACGDDEEKSFDDNGIRLTATKGSKVVNVENIDDFLIMLEEAAVSVPLGLNFRTVINPKEYEKNDLIIKIEYENGKEMFFTSLFSGVNEDEEQEHPIATTVFYIYFLISDNKENYMLIGKDDIHPWVFNVPLIILENIDDYIL